MDSPLIDPVWLKALAKTLLLPPTGLLLIALLGLALRRRFARMGGGMAWAGVVGLLLLSVPAVAGFMVRFLDASPPFERSQASNAQAIVILGGGPRHGPGGDRDSRLRPGQFFRLSPERRGIARQLLRPVRNSCKSGALARADRLAAASRATRRRTFQPRLCASLPPKAKSARG